MELMIPSIYGGTFVIGEHNNCPLSDYSRKINMNVDIFKYFPACHKELCGIIFNIPASRTISEVEALGGKNLRVIGAETYDNSTVVVGTMKDEITNYLLFSSNFITVNKQSFQKGGKEIIEVATIFPNQLENMLDGLSKLVDVEFRESEKIHLSDFVGPQIKSMEITKEEQTIINNAIDLGFLDIPRKIDLNELATSLGTSKGYLSPKLREIYRKVLKTYTHRVTKL